MKFKGNASSRDLLYLHEPGSKQEGCVAMRLLLAARLSEICVPHFLRFLVDAVLGVEYRQYGILSTSLLQRFQHSFCAALTGSRKDMTQLSEISDNCAANSTYRDG